MTIDNTVDLALIVALISLVSPLLTTLFNILYQLFIRHTDKKEQYYKEQIKPIEDVLRGYLNAVGKCIALDTAENEDLYGEYYPSILLNVSPENRQIFIDFNRDMSKSKIDNFDEKLDKLASTVQIELDRLHKSQKR